MRKIRKASPWSKWAANECILRFYHCSGTVCNAVPSGFSTYACSLDKYWWLLLRSEYHRFLDPISANLWIFSLYISSTHCHWLLTQKVCRRILFASMRERKVQFRFIEYLSFSELFAFPLLIHRDIVSEVEDTNTPSSRAYSKRTVWLWPFRDLDKNVQAILKSVPHTIVYVIRYCFPEEVVYGI